MAETARLICRSAELVERGKGVRFEVATEHGTAQAFLVRYGGKAFAYLNRCTHIGVELDWNAGEFFDESGLYLVCATHGATYLPDVGACVAGPCRGASLQRLEIVERDGGIYLT